MSARTEPRSVARGSAEHYTWGDGCDGWYHLRRDDLAVIQERLFGGRTANGEYMVSSAVPLFDVGERSIVFVRGNGAVKHPLVGWQQGRLRVVEGRVYSDDGREVQLSAGEFRLGARRALEEVYTHRIAGTDQVLDTRTARDLRPATTGVEDSSDSSAPLAPPRPTPSAGAVTAEDFAAWLDQSVARAHSAAALAALPLVRSADPTARFVGPSFRPVALSSAARE